MEEERKENEKAHHANAEGEEKGLISIMTLDWAKEDTIMTPGGASRVWTIGDGFRTFFLIPFGPYPGSRAMDRPLALFVPLPIPKSVCCGFDGPTVAWDSPRKYL